MIMTIHDKMVCDNSTLCHICNEEFGEDGVRDHCVLSGKVRGAAHEGCNVKYKVPKFFPVVFHNLSGYDSHLSIKTLGNSEGDFLVYQIMRKTTFLLRNRSALTNLVIRKEKKVYVKRELRFIDSLRFMASSHDKLSINLKIYQFVNLKKYYSGNQLSLLLRKGVYPYDYVDSIRLC